MAGESDEDWARAAAELEEAPTRAEKVSVLDEAVPRAVPPFDSTGKYKTLPGFEVARETVEKMAYARGVLEGRRVERDFLLMAFVLAQMNTGETAPEVAHENANRLRAWASRPESVRRICAALGWGDGTQGSGG